MFAQVTCRVLSMTITFSIWVSTALPTMMPPRKSAHTSASFTRKFLMVAPFVSAKKPVSRSGSNALFAYFKPVTVWFSPSNVPANGCSELPSDRCFTVSFTIICISLSPSVMSLSKYTTQLDVSRSRDKATSARKSFALVMCFSSTASGCVPESAVSSAYACCAGFSAQQATKASSKANTAAMPSCAILLVPFSTAYLASGHPATSSTSRGVPSSCWFLACTAWASTASWKLPPCAAAW